MNKLFSQHFSIQFLTTFLNTISQYNFSIRLLTIRSPTVKPPPFSSSSTVLPPPFSSSSSESSHYDYSKIDLVGKFQITLHRLRDRLFETYTPKSGAATPIGTSMKNDRSSGDFFSDSYYEDLEYKEQIWPEETWIIICWEQQIFQFKVQNLDIKPSPIEFDVTDVTGDVYIGLYTKNVLSPEHCLGQIIIPLTMLMTSYTTEMLRGWFEFFPVLSDPEDCGRHPQLLKYRSAIPVNEKMITCYFDIFILFLFLFYFYYCVSRSPDHQLITDDLVSHFFFCMYVCVCVKMSCLEGG